MKLSTRIWSIAYIDVPILYEKLRKREEALATTEWALLVAGVSALAIAVVAVVRNQTDTATTSIQTGVNVDTSL